MLQYFNNQKKQFLGNCTKLMGILVLATITSCSSESVGETEYKESAEIFFELRFNDVQKAVLSGKTLAETLPDCSEAEPSYVEIILTGTENIGSEEQPFRVDIESGSLRTSKLILTPGSYQLEYFAVYDAMDNPVLMAANQNGDMAQYVENPLPINIEASLSATNEIKVDVVCFENRILVDLDAILAKDYAANLGKGFDVTWSEFTKYMNLYSEQAVLHFKEAGFKNVRIRMGEENLTEAFINNLKVQVDDCLRNGIIPILAYQGHYLEETATNDIEANDHLVTWWATMAEAFKDYPAELAFNILIEISGRYKTDYEGMNAIYVNVYNAIRETNKNRVIIFPPVNISNPDFLEFLEIPGEDDPYTMAEWHFYAAGPNISESSKKYWVDGSTQQERLNITEPIQTAVQWMNQTGKSTWVGAWMAGNYNKGNDFSIPEQVAFATFMTRELAKENIPWSINAGNKYYDYETNTWFNETDDAAGIPVRDVILNTEQIALYSEQNYLGEGHRLDVGTYTTTDLQNLGITSISSLMVPFDFEVNLYTEDNRGGTAYKATETQPTLAITDIKSIEIIALGTYD